MKQSLTWLATTVIFAGLGLLAPSGTIATPTGLTAAAPEVALAPPAIAYQVITEKQRHSSQTGEPTGWYRLNAHNATIESGDILRYTIIGTNQTQRPLTEWAMTQAIPPGTQLFLPSVYSRQATVSYSRDGGFSFEPPNLVALAAETLPAGIELVPILICVGISRNLFRPRTDSQ
jgi:uncharacterized repeat protein (TIGR01451 family)